MAAPKKRTIRTIPQQRTPVLEQAAADRVTNFSEVSCGSGEDEADEIVPGLC